MARTRSQKPGPTKKIMRSFAIDEISGVTRPAQEGAVAILMKRRDDQTLEKQMVLTTATDGHAHLILDKDDQGGITSHHSSVNGEFSHAHPWTKDDEGNIVIGEAEGHAHSIRDGMIKMALDETQEGEFTKFLREAGFLPESNKEGRTMDKSKSTQPTEDERIKKLEESNEALLKQNKTITALLNLSGEHRKFYDGIAKEADKEAFLAKSLSERDQIVKGQTEENPVVYTSDAGVQYFKNDDPRAIANAKELDALKKTVKDGNERLTMATYEKRAMEEIPNLPGSVQARAAMLKAIDGIEDEGMRKTSLDTLKAQSVQFGQLFKTYGVATIIDKEGGGSEDELEQAVEKLMADESLDRDEAFQKIMSTEVGQDLYNKKYAYRPQDGQRV